MRQFVADIKISGSQDLTVTKPVSYLMKVGIK